MIASLAFAGDEAPSGAFLSGNQSVYINGAQVTTSSMAVMVGDVVQTKNDGLAQMTSAGSTAILQSNTILRFQRGGIAIDRGTVSIGTGNGSSVFARDFRITPTSSSWTQFDVVRANGVIQILARKNNLTVSCGTGSPTVLKEGQQLSRDDGPSCGLAAKGSGAPAAAKGPILTSATAEKGGLVVGGGIVAWAIFQADDPVSPFIP
jgi:hypothetical protein